jgi:glycosyltransferase involved in cell wall biosynthesis
MNKLSDTVIVIPCYNEASRLPYAEFEQYLHENPSVLLLFVNDGSKDDTSSILHSLESMFANARVLDIAVNGGKANAVRQGFLYALANFPSQHIGYFDADLATPLYEIQRFLSYFEANNNLEMVVGSRVQRMGADINRDTKRHIFGRIFATLASFTLVLPIYDTQCGAKMFKYDLATEVFAEPFNSKWLFDVEIFARVALKSGFPQVTKIILEHPLEHWFEKGDSRIKGNDFFIFPLDLIKIYRKYHRKLKKNKKS